MWYRSLLEKNLVPDFLLRNGIRQLLTQRLIDETHGDVEQNQFHFIALLEKLRQSPIAVNTQEANEQHYEIPTLFYQMVLGKNLKYSACYYETGKETLSQAEDKMLATTISRADLKDGLQILELGCGWGSLSLYMAEKYPNSRIVAVSNSKTQKEFIDLEAKKRGINNLSIITCNINDFQTDMKFDRVVSVEMFEHTRNYEVLMQKVANFLTTGGKLFVHIFTHRNYTYLFEEKDESDWMSKYFFTGGTMPSDYLLLYFQKQLKIEKHWRVNGKHYAQTSKHWLQNMDKHKAEITPLFEQTYGKDQALKWWVYWRIFFMSCAELWGYNEGNEWFVSHYLFVK